MSKLMAKKVDIIRGVFFHSIAKNDKVDFDLYELKVLVNDRSGNLSDTPIRFVMSKAVKNKIDNLNLKTMAPIAGLLIDGFFNNRKKNANWFLYEEQNVVDIDTESQFDTTKPSTIDSVWMNMTLDKVEAKNDYFNVYFKLLEKSKMSASPSYLVSKKGLSDADVPGTQYAIVRSTGVYNKSQNGNYNPIRNLVDMIITKYPPTGNVSAPTNNNTQAKPSSNVNTPVTPPKVDDVPEFDTDGDDFGEW